MTTSTFEFHDGVLSGVTLHDGVLDLSFDILPINSGASCRSVAATIRLGGVDAAELATLLLWELPTWLRGEGIFDRDGNEIEPNAVGPNEISAVELARTVDAGVIRIAARTVEVIEVGAKRPVTVYR